MFFYGHNFFLFMWQVGTRNEAYCHNKEAETKRLSSWWLLADSRAHFKIDQKKYFDIEAPHFSNPWQMLWNLFRILCVCVCVWRGYYVKKNRLNSVKLLWNEGKMKLALFIWKSSRESWNLFCVPCRSIKYVSRLSIYKFIWAIFNGSIA